MVSENSLRIAASSDWHIRADVDNPRYFSVGQYQDILREMSQGSDAIVHCGDITDYEPSSGEEGLKRSVFAAAQVFRESTLPKIAVLGNHDHEGDRVDLVRQILRDEGGVILLQGQSHTLSRDGITLGVAGAKGLGGGYGKYMLPHFGEKSIRIYREAIDGENKDLEKALGGLRTDKVVVLTHYSPIRATIMSEGAELFHGLGNSGIEDTIDAFSDRVVLALHGHAHMGDMHGRTRKGINVDNVAIQVLKNARQRESDEFNPTNLFTKYSIS